MPHPSLMPPQPYLLSPRELSSNVVIPYLIPPVLKCGICPLVRVCGPWSTSEKHMNEKTRKHIKEKHDVEIIFQCSKCRDEFESLHNGRINNPCRRSAHPATDKIRLQGCQLSAADVPNVPAESSPTLPRRKLCPKSFLEAAVQGSSPPTENHQLAASLFSDCCWSNPDAEQLPPLGNPYGWVRKFPAKTMISGNGGISTLCANQHTTVTLNIFQLKLIPELYWNCALLRALSC